MELIPGQQLYVNSKWFMDVKAIDNQDVKVRIKYSEGTEQKFIYKVIKLSQNLFMDPTVKNGITYCRVNDNDLRKAIGGLVDRMAKEKDVYSLLEDAAGMGAVSMAGLSGVPGVPGTAGSGDIGNTLVSKPAIAAGTYGLEDLSKTAKYLRKHFKKGRKQKDGIKTPLLNVLKEANDVENKNTDNDYKLTLYQFLDYPYDNEFDIKMVNVVNEWRPSFLEASAVRIKLYFSDLYKANKDLIKKNCTDQFINQIMVLGEIS